jgi:hypothetical protein
MKGRSLYRVFFMIAILSPIITGSVYGMVEEPVIQQDSVTFTADNPQVEEDRPVAEYFEWILYRMGKIPLVLVILYGITIFSIISMLILLVYILLNRSRMEREANLRAYLMEKYQRLLMDYLFDDGKGKWAYKEMEKEAKKPLNRQILIDQIIDIMVNLKGDIKQKTKDLYLKLGLKKDSLKKSRSRKWHKKIKGYRELAFMNIRSGNKNIIRSINSNNKILRMEAQIAMVRLSDDNPFEWMHKLDKPLSIWHQITLLELILQHDMKVPEFKQWCCSKNLSIAIFALEMISKFEQKEAEEEVLSLFDHENEKLRCTAFRISGDMEFRKALGPMEARYPKETFNNKLMILKSFAKIPEESYLGFLKSVLDEEENVQLQIQATKAIKNMDEPGVSILEKLMESKSEYKNYEIIIRHVLDGRIN